MVFQIGLLKLSFRILLPINSAKAWQKQKNKQKTFSHKQKVKIMAFNIKVSSPIWILKDQNVGFSRRTC